MKKREINARKRWTILAITLAMSIVGIGLLVSIWNRESTIKKDVPIYTYSTNPSIDYEVELEPNMQLGNTTLSSGESYIAEFVKGIKSTLRYSLKGSSPTQMNGYYEVVGQARGYNVRENSKQVIWARDYQIVPIKPIDYLGEELVLEEVVDIDYRRHNVFVREVAEITKINMPAEFVVTLQGELEIEVEGDIIKKEVRESLIIPLGVSYFNISEEGVEEQVETKVKTIEEVVPPKYYLQVAIGLFILINVLITSFVLLGTKGMPNKINLSKEIKKIFLEYGGYLVGVDTFDEKQFTHQYRIQKIQDLIKVAEELKQPIVYVCNRNIGQIKYFYVSNNHFLYRYDVERNFEKRKVRLIGVEQNL